MDMYWGGPERRITGITVRIFTVNLIALLSLLIGILYLGQYQESLIGTKLLAFGNQANIVAAALNNGAYTNEGALNKEKVSSLTKELGANLKHRVRVFDQTGALIADSDVLLNTETLRKTPYTQQNQMSSIRVLKSLADFFLSFLPKRQNLSPYPAIDADHAMRHPDAMLALNGQDSLSAWQNENGDILLSAARALKHNNSNIGSILLMRSAHDIKRDITDMWLNIMFIFAMIFLLTIALSIYLSGVIARPLRKLAKAAESVRTGRTDMSHIPDMSNRHDEIGELSIALRSMTSALQERMDSIESFASDVAHELKNPLTSLKSAVETAGIVKKTKDRDKLMKVIFHDVERLDRLITDISHISRLDTELSREDFETLNLKSLLQQTLSIYQDPIKREKNANLQFIEEVEVRGVQITLNFHAGRGIYVYASESRLMQIFENLLTNALSFSPKGSIINIRVVPSKTRVLIHIEDEGPGIPEGMKEKIFERFYSQRPNHEAYGQNSGLGLSICKQIVTALGGAIYADNIKDADGQTIGARFTVMLKTV